MATTVEQRVAELVRELISERGTTAAEVAARQGIEPAAVERLLSGREPLELNRLERVLETLGAHPAEFFARLYGGGPAPADAASASASAGAASSGPASPADQPITRREVEEVLGTLRSMIDGMVRMLDAEREAGRSDDRPG